MAVAPLRQQTRLTLARQLSAISKKPDAISLWPFSRIAIAYEMNSLDQARNMSIHAFARKTAIIMTPRQYLELVCNAEVAFSSFGSSNLLCLAAYAAQVLLMIGPDSNCIRSYLPSSARFRS